MTNTIATAKPSSAYPQEVIEAMVTEYQANPVRATVDMLAERFNKPTRSVIAKLSALGVYQKVERVTKRGEPVVKKEVFVAQVQEALGIELASFDKMTKADLQALVEAVQAR